MYNCAPYALRLGLTRGAAAGGGRLGDRNRILVIKHPVL